MRSIPRIVPLVAVVLAVPLTARAQINPDAYQTTIRGVAPTDVMIVQPEFPVKAARQGVEKGFVDARLQVDDEGRVTAVEVTRAHPTGTFERAATGALLQWKFRKGSVDKAVDVTIDFARPSSP